MAVLSLVEVQNLTCERGGRRIFKDISFAAAAGQALTLEGPTGAAQSSARPVLSNRPRGMVDELLSSLDAAGRRLAAELIGEHCDDGGIAIVATHETLGLDAPRFFLGAT